MRTGTDDIIENLFRNEYGKLIATLTNIFGTAHIQLAEDLVQDTLIVALDHWSVNGVPENPTGWLFKVAKRKILNSLKREQTINEIKEHLIPANNLVQIDEVVLLENEIQDNQLRMIFTCCHYSLSTESMIALTLKTLCGFSVKEVAKALLTTESTINKRLYRAKLNIKESGLSFVIPRGKELDDRLITVSLTLYLLFNEGYNSSTGDSVIKKDLCLEAIRLTQLLVDRFPDRHNLSALLALMCFQTARFEARIDDNGTIILFEDQDRSKWDKNLINIGILELQKSIGKEQFSPYHLEAGIAMEHCTATNFESTNWPYIYQLYELLFKIKPNSIILLNMAIITSKIDGIDASLLKLRNLTSDKMLIKYHWLPATQGVFSMEIGKYKEAVKFLEHAILLTDSKPEIAFLSKKLNRCLEKS